jgi:hypothetical protein
VLARELESGTFRFAWTQSAGRVRLAAARLVPLAAVLTAAAYPECGLPQADNLCVGERLGSAPGPVTSLPERRGAGTELFAEVTCEP